MPPAWPPFGRGHLAHGSGSSSGRAWARNRISIVGLADGGAHVGTICDGSFPTTLLAHWGRDRVRGPRLELPWLVKAQTADTAAAYGLDDRGRVRVGLRADLNVIDFGRLVRSGIDRTRT